MKSFKTMDNLSEAGIGSIQDTLLAETAGHAYRNSPYYRSAFDRIGLKPDDIRGVGDILKLPLTDRADVQNDNRSFFAVGNSEIAEIVSTTGTTGESIFIALSAEDLDRLARNEERSFGYAGVTADDLFHLAVTCDNLFIAGAAYYGGLRRTGAAVVRVGPQNTIRHLDLIKKLRPTGMVAVPSFVARLARLALENGIDAKSLGLKKIVLIGDSIRNPDFNNNCIGEAIENYFGDICLCYSTYGITEAQVSFCECRLKQGLHSHPDFVIAEIIDEKGAVLPDGEIGELVLTPLRLKATPLIRYKTGDITFKISTACACGRNSVRIGSIIGRKHHRLKLKGVTIYPKTIENAIVGIRDVINFQIEAYDEDGADNIILRVGSHNTGEGFMAGICDVVRAKARVTPRIEIESPEDIEKRLFEGGSRKAVTFKDKRVKSHA
jgi:phenylacetate-CoA ligase